jgi:hypothetical protein
MRYLLLPLLLFSTCCYAQDASVFKPDSVKKEIIATRISNSIHVDGHLNEPDWQRAIPSSEFIQIEPKQGQPPNQKTTVRVLFNSQYFYVGVIALDSMGKKAIRATDYKRDFSLRSHDFIALSFDAFNDHRNAMSFVTNAYGVQRDLLVFDDILTILTGMVCGR